MLCDFVSVAVGLYCSGTGLSRWLLSLSLFPLMAVRLFDT